MNGGERLLKKSSLLSWKISYAFLPPATIINISCNSGYLLIEGQGYFALIQPVLKFGVASGNEDGRF